MGILDKITRTLRKVTPKEIAPALPFLSMVVPGLGLAGTGIFNQYLLPQLLTAAGSARQSGEINLLNQAMTLGASYASGAGGSAASEGQKAFATRPGVPQTEMVNASRSARGASALGQVPNPTLAASNPAAYASAHPDAYKAFMKANPDKTSMMSGLRENILQPMNAGLNDPFSLAGLTTVGGLGGTMATSDYAKRKENEFEEEEALRLGRIGAYRDATGALSDYFRDTTYSLEDIYGPGNVPDFLLADGGRVGAMNGGMMRQGYNNGSDSAGVVEGISKERFAELVQFGMDEGMGIAESFEYAKRMAEGEKLNKGGRVNYNMGGIMNAGSIPQTPSIPQGMQINGQGGGFIPMGAEEKVDDVPAMLAKNEFVMTSDAVRAAGGGSIEKGAQKMYDVMNQLESQA